MIYREFKKFPPNRTSGNSGNSKNPIIKETTIDFLYVYLLQNRVNYFPFIENEYRYQNSNGSVTNHKKIVFFSTFQHQNYCITIMHD